jgi:hypothetical protein
VFGGVVEQLTHADERHDELLLSARARFQYFDSGQRLSFHELEECTAAGGDVRDLLRHTVFVDRRQRIAATGDGKRTRCSRIC